MTDINNKFNSKYGIDLGKLSTISISGSKTLQDKVLILRQNSNSGEYYLEPQDIGIQHGTNDTSLTLKNDNLNYIKSFVFDKKTTINDTDTILNTIRINFSNKQQGMLSIRGTLFAKEVDQKNIFQNYTFTTGKNLPFKYNTATNYYARHIYDKIIYLYNNGELKQVNEEKFKKYEDVSTSNIHSLQPMFSTIGGTSTVVSNLNLPFIEVDETTDGIYNINIKCNPFKSDTKTIEWFGNFEIILTAT